MSVNRAKTSLGSRAGLNLPCGRKKIIVIVGPTAIGKTSLAIDLARRIEGEIISSDSMQVYKGMDIITQAPSKTEMSGVRHDLIKCVDPRKEYSVATFRRAAVRAIGKALRSGNVPIVVGGTGLYVKALIDGLFPSPAADEKFRGKMRLLASKNGSPSLHKKLCGIDPEAASHIHPNDARRIIRALEIFHLTGKTMTDLKKNTKGLKDKYDIRIFGLKTRRKGIYKNINMRVDKMFREGVIDEVAELKRKKLSRTAGTAIGITEISAYLEGRCSLEDAKDELKKNTRNFAKRQLTWFNADKRIRWFDVTRVSRSVIIRSMCASLRSRRS